jgi:hypothetical protein
MVISLEPTIPIPKRRTNKMEKLLDRSYKGKRIEFIKAVFSAAL